MHTLVSQAPTSSRAIEWWANDREVYGILEIGMQYKMQYNSKWRSMGHGLTERGQHPDH